MSLKHNMKKSVISVLKHNHDNSFQTQSDRRTVLLNIADTLYQLGYKMNSLSSMKQKHIYALVHYWQENNISPSTMKNRMSNLRWLLGKWDKANMVPTNTTLGIPKRVYVTNQDKSRQLTDTDISAIKAPLMQLSLRAQALFGLRVEESLKLQPFVADAGDFLYLKGSWTKGGRERNIPILTNDQRQWLDEAKALVKYKGNSLIPTDTNYSTYRSRFDKACSRAGICHKHGFRHHYAQQRYKELTGWDCPVQGGPHRSTLNREQKAVDWTARLHISESLGHSRTSITAVYLGS